MKKRALLFLIIPFLFGCGDYLEVYLKINPQKGKIEKIIVTQSVVDIYSPGEPTLKHLERFSIINKKMSRINVLSFDDEFYEGVGLANTLSFASLYSRNLSEDIQKNMLEKLGKKDIPRTFPFRLRLDVDNAESIKSVSLEIAGKKYPFKKNREEEGLYQMNLVPVLKSEAIQNYVSAAIAGRIQAKEISPKNLPEVYLNVSYINK